MSNILPLERWHTSILLFIGLEFSSQHLDWVAPTQEIQLPLLVILGTDMHRFICTYTHIHKALVYAYFLKREPSLFKSLLASYVFTFDSHSPAVVWKSAAPSRGRERRTIA